MNSKLKVLLIGSGGRESALAYKIKQSALLGELKVFPGNGGFDQSEIIPSSIFDLKNKFSTQTFIENEKFDLVIVGPEEPLVDGISDWLAEIHIPCFGPSAYCAQLEGSKDFAKNLMREFGVPTANSATFRDCDSAKKYLHSQKLPIVIKADGLAAGKGVTVCSSIEEANGALEEIFIEKKFPGISKVVIEEFLEGQETSIFALCDGEDFIMLPAACDHKRAYDNDEGPNTGGMGAFCPAPIATTKVLKDVEEKIFGPLLAGLKKKGYPYRGLLYAGLMIDKSENAMVVEFNCRFGDPETQVVVRLIEDDLLRLIQECASEKLSQKSLSLKSGYASVVVLAAEGYPGEYAKGIDLNLPEPKDKNTIVFHAGTSHTREGKIKSMGGRILGISSYAESLADSVQKAYEYLGSISVPKTFFRKDIAKKAL
ncbi:MAG: phosphoribosylamine--glycine ligase [Leptospira sp.]|nr:phosphoribosylamine--glycine ligase [Leptospira sp.]